MSNYAQTLSAALSPSGAIGRAISRFYGLSTPTVVQTNATTPAAANAATVTAAFPNPPGVGNTVLIAVAYYQYTTTPNSISSGPSGATLIGAAGGTTQYNPDIAVYAIVVTPGMANSFSATLAASGTWLDIGLVEVAGSGALPTIFAAATSNSTNAPTGSVTPNSLGMLPMAFFSLYQPNTVTPNVSGWTQIFNYSPTRSQLVIHTGTITTANTALAGGASLSSTGAVADVIILIPAANTSAGMGLTGTLNKLAQRAYTAALSPAATFKKVDKKALTAALAPAGSIIRSLTRVLTTAALSPIGNLAKTTQRALPAAAIAFTGAFSKAAGVFYSIATPSVVQVSTPASGNVISVTATLPSPPSPGNIVLIAVAYYQFTTTPNSIATPPAGATLVGLAGGTSQYNPDVALYALLVTGSTPNSFAVTLSASTWLDVGVVEFSGASGLPVIYSGKTYTSATSPAATNAVTPNVLGMLPVAVFGIYLPTTVTPSVAGWTSIFNNSPTRAQLQIHTATPTQDTVTPVAGGISLLASTSSANIIALIPPANFSAGMAFSGAINRATSRSLAAGVNLVGSVRRQTARALAAAFSFAGSLATGHIQSIALSAGLSFAGSVVKNAQRGFSAGLASSATIARGIARSLAASVSSTGAVSRATARVLSASTALSGAVSRQAQKSFAASVAATGTISRATSLVLAAGLVSAGMFGKAFGKSFTAGLASSGSIVRGLGKNLTAGLASAGTLAKSVQRSFTASVSPSGSIARTASKAFTATVSFVGSLGTQHGRTMALTATMGLAGSIVRGTSRGFTAAVSPAASVARSLLRTFATASLAPAASFSKAAVKAFTAALAPSTTFGRSIRRVWAVVLTPAGNLGKSLARVFAPASLGVTGSFRKSAVKAFTAALAPVGSFGRSIGLAFNANLNPSGSIGRSISRVFAAIVSLVESLGLHKVHPPPPEVITVALQFDYVVEIDLQF